MPLKDRIFGFFKKSKITPEEQKNYTEIMKEANKPTSQLSSKYTEKYTDPITLEKPKIALDSSLYKRFEIEVPGKKAIWGGKETKAFLKWKEDNNF